MHTNKTGGIALFASVKAMNGVHCEVAFVPTPAYSEQENSHERALVHVFRYKKKGRDNTQEGKREIILIQYLHMSVCYSKTIRQRRSPRGRKQGTEGDSGGICVQQWKAVLQRSQKKQQVHGLKKNRPIKKRRRM